jgi:hypothetical protein
LCPQLAAPGKPVSWAKHSASEFGGGTFAAPRQTIQMQEFYGGIEAI